MKYLLAQLFKLIFALQVSAAALALDNIGVPKKAGAENIGFSAGEDSIVFDPSQNYSRVFLTIGKITRIIEL